MKKISKLLFFVITFFISNSAFAESDILSIPLKMRSGVYEVQSIINSELKVSFVVDSGAATVVISEEIFKILLQNESITKKDILGEEKYTIADGSTVSGTMVLIKKIDLSGFILKNVKAVVMKGDNVPLLLGQTALKKLGRWSINSENGTLEIVSKDFKNIPPKIPEPKNSTDNIDTKKIYSNWRRINSSKEDITYAFVPSIKKNGNIGSIWLLEDYKDSSSKTGRNGILSEKIQYEFECSKNKIRTPTVIFYMGHMGEGEIKDSMHTQDDSWRSIVPESFGESLFDSVCNKKNLQSDPQEEYEIFKANRDIRLDKRLKETECKSFSLVSGIIYSKNLINNTIMNKEDYDYLISYPSSCNQYLKDIDLKRFYEHSSGLLFNYSDFINAIDNGKKCIKYDKLNLNCQKTIILSYYKLENFEYFYTEINKFKSIIAELLIEENIKLKNEKSLRKRGSIISDSLSLETQIADVYSETILFEKFNQSISQCLDSNPKNYYCYNSQIKYHIKQNQIQEALNQVEKYKLLRTVILKNNILLLSKTSNLEDKKYLNEQIDSLKKELSEINRTLETGIFPK